MVLPPVTHLICGPCFVLMIYQLWSYYMFLVRDMDDMTEAVPTIVGVVKWCNDTLAYTWPFGMCEISQKWSSAPSKNM